jgi:hypothetical protein
MKIIVKQSDKYVSELYEDKVIYQYLIYVYDNENSPLGCEQVLGEDDKDNVIKHFISMMISKGDIERNEKTTYDDLYNEYVDFVLYDDFKQAITENKPTYNG